jgi:hypothetical protein
MSGREVFDLKNTVFPRKALMPCSEITKKARKQLVRPEGSIPNHLKTSPFSFDPRKSSLPQVRWKERKENMISVFGFQASSFSISSPYPPPLSPAQTSFGLPASIQAIRGPKK